MSNAMRTGKRTLAGVAAGALAAGMLSAVAVGAAAPASAATYTVAAQFPSMTVVQNVDDSIAIGLSTSLNGDDTSIVGTTVVVSITNAAGASVLNSGGTTDDTKFNVDDSNLVAGDLSTGTGKIVLMTGDSSAGGGTFAGITPGTYTLGLSWVNDASSVAFASTTMPITVVSAANAGTITGSVRWLTTGAWSTAETKTSETVATDDSISDTDPYYAAFLNATNGPIVSTNATFSATATPNRAAGTTSFTTVSANNGNGSQPGIVTFTTSTSGDAGTWSSTATTGEIKANFATPVNQITGTLPVTISAAADIAVASLAITSDVTGTADGSPSADEVVAVPAVNGLKFTVSGITTVGGTASAGVPVTFTAVGKNNGNTGTSTAFSAISPAVATTVTSGTGGAVSLEYTVSNPNNDTGVEVTASYPGGTARTFFIQFQTAAIASVTATPANVTAANSGTATVAAAVVDQFARGIANWPVQVSVTGVGATTTAQTLTTDADGVVSYSITVPSGTVSGATSVVNWSGWSGSAFTGNTATTTVTYTSQSAAVAALAVRGSFAANATTWATLTDGKLNSSTNPLYVDTQVDTTATYSPANDGFNWSIQVTATNDAGTAISGAPVTLTAPDGAFVLSAANKWVSSRTAFSNTSGQVTFVLASTKTGDITYSVGSGDVTGAATAVYANRPTDARYVAVAANPTTVTGGNGSTITATVTDRFGNAVAGVTVGLTETGPGYIAGTGTGATSASGTFEGSLVSVAGLTGISTVTATVAKTQTVTMPTAIPTAATTTTPTGSVAGATIQVGDLVNIVTSYGLVSPTGAGTASTVEGVTAGASQAAVPIEVVSGPTEQTITITGERTAVRGKPGVMVDGTTTGFALGAILRPWFKFPGESSYNQGVKEILVDEDGEFTWQRRTGKKIYISIRSEDGSVKSNRLILPAK